MVDIIIVEDDTALLETLMDGLSLALPEFSVRGASRVEEAMAWMATEAPRLVISDIMLPGKSGINFLIETRMCQPMVKFILMSAFPSISAEEALAQGAIRLMRKPFPIADLLQTVKDTLDRDHFDGSVEGLSLMDLMQLLHWAKRSSIIFVEGKDVSGKIHFHEGEVVHAQNEKEIGIAAFKSFVRLDRGSFKIRSATKKPEKVTIQGSFQKLALDTLRQLDEASRKGAGEGADNRAVLQTDLPLPIAGDTQGHYPVEDLLTNAIAEQCRIILERGEDILACGVIDLRSGLFLGLHHRISVFTPLLFDAVASAAIATFTGKEVRRIENLLSQYRKVKVKDAVEEAFLNTGDVLHFMKAVPDKKAILVLVTKKTANMAMGWVSLRAAVPDIQKVIG